MYAKYTRKRMQNHHRVCILRFIYEIHVLKEIHVSWLSSSVFPLPIYQVYATLQSSGIGEIGGRDARNIHVWIHAYLFL